MVQHDTVIKPANFIIHIIDDDLASGRVQGGIVTRFPPEPNGFLHIGHAWACHLNFSLPNYYPGSRCHLRMDDTNPEREDVKYVEAIKKDVAWLGFSWSEHFYYASDYFDKLHEIAIDLIKRGKAYICQLSPDELIEYRGHLTKPGRESPYRNRSVEENLELFAKMTRGEFAPGTCVLRAKIDMNSGNLHMRDPVVYRIRNFPHPRTGDKWKIYPSYDFSHCLSDAIEGITHSLCSLEFQDHRPLYDWFVAEANLGHTPHQYEFSRLNINYTVTSKRKLLQLVTENHVEGWDDPRMPTIAGMRNRGYPPSAIKKFCAAVGVSRRESIIDFSFLEEFIRNELNETAPRAMAVLRPLKVTIENYPEDKSERLILANHPKDESFGSREIGFSRQLYIEQDDFMEEAPKDFFRLSIGKEVRLRGAYIIKCHDVVRDQTGAVIELRCTYDPETLGKNPVGRKVKGVIHWVDERFGSRVTVREYDRLFREEDPNKDEKEGISFLTHINPASLIHHHDCWVEESLINAKHEETFQFERLGYFIAKRDSANHVRFDKVVSLKDSWAKVQKVQSKS